MDWLDEDYEWYYGVRQNPNAPKPDKPSSKKGPAERSRPAKAIALENKRMVLQRQIQKTMIDERTDLLKYVGDV